MSINTALHNTVSNSASNSVNNSAKSSTTASTVSKTENGFADMFAHTVNAVPSQTLSPEVLKATLPTTTIQTSSYVFDPLGVVGTVPESNTFLQAIRQMMGKPAEAAAAPVIAAKTEPAANTHDFLDSLEAQLNYQGLSTAAVAAKPTPTPSPVVASTASDMLSQYMSSATSAVSATDIETTLVNALDQETEEQAA
jgi:hypothetical protein